MNAEPVLRAEAVTRRLGAASCRDVSLRVCPGEVVAVWGEPASGASTLLRCLAGLDVPDGGTVVVGGRDLTAMRPQDRVALRRGQLGLMLPAAGLIPVLTAAENIEAPMRLAGLAAGHRRDRVSQLLAAAGVSDGRHFPAALSLAARRRVSVVRAFAARPPLVLLDEPAGDLTDDDARDVLTLIRTMTDAQRTGVVVATGIAFPPPDRQLNLRRGALVTSGGSAQPW